MEYLGDYYSGCLVSMVWTTVTTTGAPTALAGRPGNLSAGNAFPVVWKLDGAWTCSTAGITVAFDCKGATGWNGASVNTNADPAFYSCGEDYALVFHGGTVGGTCVSYYTLAHFSLKNRAALLPTVSGRQADVSAGGEVGLDWANIGSPQTVQRLGCTSIFQLQEVCNAVTAVASVGFTEQGIACTVWSSLAAGYRTCGTFGFLNDCAISSALQPTTPNRKLDVSAGGAAGVDWANVEGSNTSNFLSCTSVFSAQTVCNAVTATASIDFTAQQNIACTVWNQPRSGYGTCGTFGYLLDCSTSSALQPTAPGRRVDISTGGTAGIDWANIDGAATAQRFGCTSIFDVTSVCNSVVVSAGSITTVTGNVNGSVGSVTGAVGSVTGNVGGNVVGSVGSLTVNNDKTGYRLSSAGTSDILDCIIAEPAGVFAWAGATLRGITAWVGAVTSNQILQSASQQGLCSRDGTVRIAKSEVSCATGVVTRGSFT